MQYSVSVHYLNIFTVLYLSEIQVLVRYFNISICAALYSYASTIQRQI